MSTKAGLIGSLLFVFIVGCVMVFAFVPVRFPFTSRFHTARPAISRTLLSQAIAVKEPWVVSRGTRVILVPHHVVAAKEIASLIGALPQSSTVYLIAPDHFSRGASEITVGSVELANRVTGASVNEKVLQQDHGVTAVTPFLERLQPNALIVPIMMRLDAGTSSRASLTRELVRRLRDDPHAIVIGSIDFSHYLPAIVADFHDALAEDVIRSVSDRDADSVELDSPAAFGVTLAVARALGLGSVKIHAHTNSLRLLGARLLQESTSHFLVSFAPGPIESRHVSTTLMTNTHSIVSAENRFYRGVSKIVFVSSTRPFAEALVFRDGQIISKTPLPISW